MNKSNGKGNIKIENFDKALFDILDEFGKEALYIMDDCIDNVSKEALKEIRKSSPKRTGAYAKAWKRKKFEKKYYISSVIYNGEFANLTHLLENGHAKSNGEGRVDGQPHIGPINDQVSERVYNEIAKRLSGK